MIEIKHADLVEDPGSTADEHRSDWLAAVAALQAEGWTAELTCAAVPVQVEGRLPSGDLFYFRARHDEALMAIGGPDPADGAKWERSEKHPGASYLPAGDGLAIIRRLGATTMSSDRTSAVV